MLNETTARSEGHLVVHRALPIDYPRLIPLHRALCQNERDQGYADMLDIDWLASTEGVTYCRAILDGTGLGLLACTCEVPQTVGFLLASPCRYSEPHSAVRLDSMFVVEAYRRKGVGRALLNAFCSWVLDQPFTSATLAVAGSNQAAVSLYRSAQFVEHLSINGGRSVVMRRPCR
jgi:ribosomal protein S18 acetylase RimI-like enzyme